MIQKIKNLLRIKKNSYRDPRPSLNDLDKKLERYLNFNNGFFIEVGANDGYSQSNTYFLEKERNWKGLLVEGIPELYKKCKNIRSKSVVKNYALVSNEFPYKSITMHFANLMSVVEGSLKKEDQEKYIKKGLEIQGLDRSYSISVPVCTLEAILDQIPNTQHCIDFFSLDVEGYELNVLKGLNLSKYRPRYILVEAIFFDEVNSFLIKNNYEMIEKLSNHDFLFKTY